MNNTIVLHKTVSEYAAQYPSDHTSTANSRRQTHCFEDLLGSQHTLSCRRKSYKSSVYTFMMYCFSARPKLPSILLCCLTWFHFLPLILPLCQSLIVFISLYVLLTYLLLLPSSLTSELLAHFNHTKKQWPFILS